MVSKDELDAIGFVICSCCGARIRANRGWCLRCYEPLVPYKPPQLPLPAWLEAIGGGTLIFAAVLSLVVLVLVITLVQANSAIDDSARPLSLAVDAVKPTPVRPNVTRAGGTCRG